MIERLADTDPDAAYELARKKLQRSTERLKGD